MRRRLMITMLMLLDAINPLECRDCRDSCSHRPRRAALYRAHGDRWHRELHRYYFGDWEETS